ncbi:hypothetical protein RUR28_00005, partial [Bacillus cabrialesii]|nr:hypothetical protein [Bacillus cabrialesii]
MSYFIIFARKRRTQNNRNCRISANRNKKARVLGLTPVFETGIKTPFKQPIADSLSVIGCLVSFEYEYCYNNEC